MARIRFAGAAKVAIYAVMLDVDAVVEKECEIQPKLNEIRVHSVPTSSNRGSGVANK